LLLSFKKEESFFLSEQKKQKTPDGLSRTCGKGPLRGKVTNWCGPLVAQEHLDTGVAAGQPGLAGARRSRPDPGCRWHHRVEGGTPDDHAMLTPQADVLALGGGLPAPERRQVPRAAL
jgi:hypothetical protein